MGNPVLIIVTGPPCTGKTTLGERIAEEFRLPLITKDGIKELLFDSLGTGDREWSRKLGFSSWGVLFYVIESLLRAGVSSVVEGNFRPQNETITRFLELRRKYAFTCLQIYCHCREDVNLQRYRERADSGTRHPGHLDDIVSRELEEELQKGTYRPLDIGGEVIHVDTTEFSEIDYTKLYRKIQEYVKKMSLE